MKALNLPPYDAKLRRVGEHSQIFDEVRRKWLKLTPEEWVRQHFIQYLKTEKGYPLPMMAVEKGLSLYGLQKRADIVCYGKQGQPLLIVECKAPEIRLNNDTFAQAANYNHQLKVPYLIITNGMDHYCAIVDLQKGTYSFLKSIPDFLSIHS